VVGFADFVVAVGSGLVHTLLGDPRIGALATVPLVLIPLFGVGLSGASHLVAFWLLRHAEVSRDSKAFRGVSVQPGRDRAIQRTM
jgi:hypothetical protein